MWMLRFTYRLRVLLNVDCKTLIQVSKNLLVDLGRTWIVSKTLARRSWKNMDSFKETCLLGLAEVQYMYNGGKNTP